MANAEKLHRRRRTPPWLDGNRRNLPQRINGRRQRKLKLSYRSTRAVAFLEAKRFASISSHPTEVRPPAVMADKHLSKYERTTMQPNHQKRLLVKKIGAETRETRQYLLSCSGAP